MPDIHLHQPLRLEMALRGTHEISLRRESIARRMRLDRIEDVLSNPTLQAHEGWLGNANRPIATTRSGDPFRRSAFLHAKHPVGILPSEDDLLQTIGRNTD
jgi:hypothetical protein